jgi:hypothetical protein
LLDDVALFRLGEIVVDLLQHPRLLPLLEPGFRRNITHSPFIRSPSS